MQLSTSQLEETAFVLKTIAHPLRLGVVCQLGQHDTLSVSELCTKLDCEQSLLSHHLNIMKLKGVLASERKGKNIYYHLQRREVLQVIDCVQDCGR